MNSFSGFRPITSISTMCTASARPHGKRCKRWACWNSWTDWCRAAESGLPVFRFTMN